MSDTPVQPESASLVERLRAYCLAKPGITPSITFGERQPSYHVLGDFLRHFAQFFLDDRPIRVQIRASVTDLAAFAENPVLQISKSMHWDGSGWKWADLLLDGALSEAEILKLLDSSYTICMSEIKPHDLQLAEIAERDLTMLQAIDALIDLNDLSPRRDVIVSLLDREIFMRSHAADEADFALGQTRIGGLPDLPESWSYPTFDGKALAFLAQVNLVEIPAQIHHDPLPAAGILYFFSVFGWQKEDGDLHPDLDWERAGEPGFSQVLYYDGATPLLRRREQPDDKKVFKAVAVDFVEVFSIPRGSDYARDPVLENLDWDEDEFERLTDLYFDFSFVLERRFGSTPDHKLLGYADPIQATLTSADTRLLCQIDSDYHNAGGDMMWGDGGTIYFIIGRDDLARGDYSHIDSDMQSG